MINTMLIITGKLLSAFSKRFNVGSGSTWPGHIALTINKNFIKDVLKSNQKLKIILIAGTNGKTTTAKLIHSILEKSGERVFQNEGGANLLNGIASTLALHSTVAGRLSYDFAIFEIDENTLPLILRELTPDYIILLNLFRDQLDRYGEVNTIAAKWGDAMQYLHPKTTLILNADDPQIAYLGSHLKGASVKYFGIDSRNSTENLQHASDSTYCPNCGSKLIYDTVYFSHLGNWLCEKCGYKHPQKTFTSAPTYPLSGIYNKYNTNAAVLLAKINNISNLTIQQSLKEFKPAFGRQEILNIDGKKIQIFLSKNPTSFNESLRTITSLNAKNVLFVLNDRIPDGRDVSWIWDVEFEEFIDQFKNITISGDRAFDMGLRIKYTNSSKNQKSKIKNQNYNVKLRGNNVALRNSKFKIEKNLEDAIEESLKLISEKDTLYILPTYSAMLEIRKILTGKKIL